MLTTNVEKSCEQSFNFTHRIDSLSLSNFTDLTCKMVLNFLIAVASLSDHPWNTPVRPTTNVRCNERPPLSLSCSGVSSSSTYTCRHSPLQHVHLRGPLRPFTCAPFSPQQHGLKNCTHVVLPYRVHSAFAQGILLGTFWVTRRKSVSPCNPSSTPTHTWGLFTP